MPIELITGPANAGKTGAVLDAFTAALAGEPVLVVPTGSDVARFEDELLAREPVAVGGRIVTFERLFELVTAATGVPAPATLSDAQRLAAVSAAVARTPLEVLAEPARRPGFARALDSFLDEIGSGGVPLDRLKAGLIAGGVPYGRELGALADSYFEVCRELGRSDRHAAAAAAIAALTESPAAWGPRPVIVYGFDDLSYEQLALVKALADAAPVTVTLVREKERVCLAARERLFGVLQSLGGDVVADLPPHRGRSTLSHLERGFLTTEPARKAPDEGLVLLAAAGHRSEVEQVGAEVAALLRDGVPADEIAVIARSPSDHASLIEQVFGSYGIPFAVQAKVPLTRTPVGRALQALVRAALGGGSAADLISFLRYPGRAGTGQVDRLERDCRIERIASAEAAAAHWQEEEGHRRLWELEALREAAGHGAGPLLRRAAGIARDLWEWPRKRQAPQLSAAERGDQLAAEDTARALEEVAEVAPRGFGAPELAELLEGLEVRRATGAPAGRVEVMSPYRARARRFDHVFVLSLQEGDFPRRGRDDPFLTDEERGAAQLPERAEGRDEERYLFYVCISRAKKCLWLSWRATDDEGKETARSFFVDDVLELLDGHPREQKRDLSDTVFAPGKAPTNDELARSLAVRRAMGGAAGLELSARLARAMRRAGFLPGDFVVPRVREELAAREVFGASSLEQYADCPFIYLGRHELSPRALEPESDALAKGSALHEALERTYVECGQPTPDDVAAIQDRARAILREVIEGTALAPEAPEQRAVHRRMESDLVRFIAWDAEHPLGLEPWKLEAYFGEREGADRPPLDLGGVKLHGAIDRIDVSGTRAFVRDYKSGSEVAGRPKLAEEKRLQLQLYMLAVRELWELDPVGAVYHPLGRAESQHPRGILRGPGDGGALPAGTFTGTDFTETEEEFDAALEEAAKDAVAIAGRIRAGRLDRDPRGGSCPPYCELFGICRIERGSKDPDRKESRPSDA